MISEDMLQQAAAQLSDAMLASVDDRPHDFSARFERRMRPLLRRAEHPVVYRLVRQCAAVFLALLIGFGSLLALSPSVRAAVYRWFRIETGWFRTTENGNVKYSPNEDTQPAVQYDYYLPEVLEGYTLLDILEFKGEREYIYGNETGQILHWGYIPGGHNASLVIINPEDYIYHTGIVGNNHADIYIAPDPSQNNVIVWECPETKVLLFISAHANADELIALAEKVEKNIIISD